MRRQSSGFSLVEMAVVLTIIALIIGGVLAGKDLLRASRVNAIVTDVQKVKAAIQQFDQKYNSLPGDFNRATSFWGTNPNCGTSAPGTGTQTCNGNGDGKIPITNDPSEQFLLPQHLALAGFIEGSYTGAEAVSNPTYYQCKAKENCIPGTIKGSAMMVWAHYPGGNAGTNGWWWEDATNDLALVYGLSTGNGYTGGGFISPQEAYGLDSKLDDGLPAWGNWRSFGGPGTYTPNCAYDSTDGSALANSQGTKALAQTVPQYNLSITNKACSIQTRLGTHSR